MRRMTVLLWVLALAPAGLSAQAVDWPRYQQEAVERLSRYLQVNTANPPGNELRAARFFQEWFESEGIPVEVFEIAPGRANLVARLKGSGSKRPLILANHADVVNANPAGWRVDPFSGVIEEGRLYGRGAMDMKGLGLLQAMVFVILHREQAPLQRDVVFLMTADEEVEFAGADWLVEHKSNLLSEAEYIITEGGQNLVEGGEIQFFGVDTAEKSPFWLKLIARGTPGHGSRPKRNAASHRLARVLARVVDWETSVKIIPGVEKFFRDVAANESGPRAAQFRALRQAVKDTEFLRSLTENEVYNYLLRNTVSLTVLQGGPQTNVIPGEAIAHLDVRLLPGEDPQDFLAQLRAVIADPEIEIEQITEPFRPATESPADNELFRAIEATVEARHPGAIVTTRMLSGATECSVFRPLGVHCYGLSPFLTTRQDSIGVHGNNESVSVENMHYGLRFLYNVVARMVR